MNVQPVLTYAGLYRVKLSNTEKTESAELQVIHELRSRNSSSGDSFLTESRPLSAVLESFAGSFIKNDMKMKHALQENDLLKTRVKESLKEDIPCSAGQKLEIKKYPLSVSSGDALDKKALLPVSSNGVFISIPTMSYVSFCHRRTHKNSAGVVDVPSMGPCPYIDGIYFSSQYPEESAAEGNNGQLYGFAMILNSSVFIDFENLESSGEYVLLCMLSSLPEFLFVKQLVHNMASILHTCAAENRYKTRKANVDIVLRERWMALSGILQSSSEYSRVFPGKKIDLPFLESSRFVDLRRSAAMCYQMIDTPLSTLFLSFNYDAIRQLHTLLLEEQRIVFIGCNAQHASACAVSAPSMVAPLKWVAPLIPYLPAASATSTYFLDTIFSPSIGYEKLRSSGRSAEKPVGTTCSECSGFIVGSTWELIPPLILRWSALAATHGGASRETQIWIADARTGNVGVLPLEPPPLNLAKVGRGILVPVTTMGLVPVSDKLQSAFSAAVKDGQRVSFRSLTSYFSQLESTLHNLEAHNSFLRKLLKEENDGSMYFDRCSTVEQWECDFEAITYNCPSLSDSSMADAHAAFLEFNTHRVCGEYRKGMTKVSNAGEIGYQLNSTVFLQPRLCSDELTVLVGETHMFKQFMGALLRIEAFGLKNALQGLSNTLQKQSRLSLHPWITSPCVLADLCLFFSRARNRFPELYPELTGVNLSQLCLSLVNSQLVVPGTESSKELQFKSNSVLPTLVSLAGTASDGSSESKGGMLKLFSKASKAVKKLQNGDQQFIMVTPYTQAFNSFSITSGSPSIPSVHSAVPTGKTLLKMEYSLPDITLEQPPTRHESAAFLPPCRRLPADVVHNFASYHEALNPLFISPCNSFKASSNATKELMKDPEADEKIKKYLDLGFLNPSSQRMWECGEKLLTFQLRQDENVKKGPSKSQEVPTSPAPSPNTIEELSVPIVQENLSLTATVSVPPPPRPPSLSDLFNSPAEIPINASGIGDGFSSGVPDGFSSGVPDGFSSGLPEGFSSGVPVGEETLSAKYVDPNE